MIKIPMKMPKYCNQCYFGRCVKSLPLTERVVEYVCQLEFEVKGEYQTRMQGVCGEYIEKPSWCFIQEEEE